MTTQEQITYLKDYHKRLMEFRVVDLNHTKRDDEFLRKECEETRIKIAQLENNL